MSAGPRTRLPQKGGVGWKMGKLLKERLAAVGLGPGHGKTLDIAAHSMGGLVALECLRTAPDTVKKSVSHVVFLAVPFKGAPALFGDFFTGNTTCCSIKVMGSYFFYSIFIQKCIGITKN